MKAAEIIKILEKNVPKNLAYPWDNVGLLCGDKNKEVKRILVTLDTNLSSVNEAAEKKCDMILSHHPILFGGIKRIDYDTAQGQMLKLLICNDIPVYAAHTNMDTAKGGINDALAELFELTEIKIIEQHTDDEKAGLGRYGRLKEKMTLNDFITLTKKKLNTPLRFCGDINRIIETATIASGSCSELIPAANERGCDVIITADLKYHDMLDASELGIAVIDAGHYPTEIIVMDIFSKLLSSLDLEIIRSENKDIFNFSF